MCIFFRISERQRLNSFTQHVVKIEKRQAGYDYLHRVGNQKLEKVNIGTCHVCYVIKL